MSAYYYLVSSLPMLMMGETAPISLENFMESCKDWLSDKELDQLTKLDLTPTETAPFDSDSSAGKWNQWETSLRNRIAKHRASSLNKDADHYTQPEKDVFSEIERIVQEAYSVNPLEREKIFDKNRWQQLDNLEAGHEFDFDKLCIYKIKLMLNEKWKHRKTEQGVENLNTILQQINEETAKEPNK